MNEQNKPLYPDQHPEPSIDEPSPDPTAESAPVQQTEPAEQARPVEPAPVAQQPPQAQPPQTAPLGATPAKPKPQAPAIPMARDAALDAEIEAALGDVSLDDLYDVQDSPDVAAAQAPSQAGETPPPGVVRGQVVGISGDDIFIDLGGKSQGVLKRDELEEGETVTPGQAIHVAIVGYDQHDGLIVLSKRTAEQQLLRRNLKRGARVDGRVVGSNKGGLELDIKGLRAFMPASQISFDRIEDFDALVGERMECEVVEVERGDKNIVVSRRKVLEQEQAQQAEQLWQEIEEGQDRTGVVRRIADYGAFVDVGGADGLLHVSELSWARIRHPKEILQVGQTIDVRVIGIDREKGRIALSMKATASNPWTVVEQKYPVGSRHRGKVVNLQEFGVFAELEPGIEGLIPISELSWGGRIHHPREVVQTGDMVEVQVLRVEPDKQRMALSIKAVQANPWMSVAQKFQPNETYVGTVARVTDFGAFVTLEDGVDGLIHISEMSDKHVAQASDIVRQGQQVQVRVLSVDEGNQRIALSMKPEHGHAVGEVTPAAEADHKSHKKKERPHRGGLEVEETDAARKLGLHMNF